MGPGVRRDDSSHRHLAMADRRARGEAFGGVDDGVMQTIRRSDRQQFGRDCESAGRRMSLTRTKPKPYLGPSGRLLTRWGHRGPNLLYFGLKWHRPHPNRNCRVRRRNFIKAVAGSAVAWSHSALGQPRE